MKTMESPQFAEIGPEYQKQNLQWAEILPDLLDTNGYFIYLYTDLTKPNKYDYWFDTIEAAYEWAEKYYGIKREDWRIKKGQ